MLSSIERPRASPSVLRSSLRKPTPCVDADSRGRVPARDVLDPDPARRRPAPSPKIARTSVVRPAPTSPAMPRISPRRSDQVRRAWPSSGREVRRAPGSARPARAARAGKSSSRSRPTMWAMIDFRSVSARRPVGDRSAVAQHGVGLRDPAHLLEEMADVDDRQPALREPLDDREQPLGVALGERAGRLVEDDDPRARDQGPGHLDQLLGAHAQVADPRLGPDVGMFEQVEGLGDDPPMLAAADQPGPDPLLAEHDVGLDRQVGRQRQLLIDHGHAARQGLARAARRVGLARERHRARVGPIRAAEDLHQRALARAVLADQGADLARVDARARRRRAPASPRTTC